MSLLIPEQTLVQNGTNVFTGGTLNKPTINVTALTINTLSTSGSTSFVSASAITLSASTFFLDNPNVSLPKKDVKYYLPWLQSLSGAVLYNVGVPIGNASNFGIVAGNYNYIFSFSNYSVILNGKGQSIYSYSKNSVLVSGYQNKIYQNSPYSFIGTGYRNKIYSSSYGTILNGKTSVVSASTNSVVLGGLSNRIYNSPVSLILNGFTNIIRNSPYAIANGYENVITNSVNAVILNGTRSFVLNSNGASILNGQYNTASTAYFSAIVSGRYNTTSASNSFISSGERNLVTGKYSSIIGGSGNTVTGDYSSIIGGQSLTLNTSNMVMVPKITIASLTSDPGSYMLVSNPSGVVYKTTLPGAAGSSIINGINTFTAGTPSSQSVNVTALTINNITVSGDSIFNTLTANTITATTISANTLFVGGFLNHSQQVILDDDYSTTSNAKSNITNLLFNIGANEVWSFEVRGQMSCSTVNGMVHSATVPAGSILRATHFANTNSATAFRSTIINTGDADSSTVCSAANTILHWQLWGTVSASSTSGQVQLRIRSGTNGDTSTVKSGTYLNARRIK